MVSTYCNCYGILAYILGELPTKSLLSLVSVSHHFLANVSQILQTRLRAITKKDTRLVLRWFAPMHAFIDPVYFCEYISTVNSHSSQNHTITKEHSDRLTGSYSHFRIQSSSDGFVSPSGGRFSWRDVVGFLQADFSGVLKPTGKEEESEPVILEWFEYFCQFCVKLDMVGVRMPDKFSSVCERLEDLVVRLPRVWLREQSERLSSTVEPPVIEKDDQIVWIDNQKTLGLKIRVEKISVEENLPAHFSNGEDRLEAFTVHLEGLATD
ncbi:hypothetical protein N7495_000362 [Penicillium taxi]|uniref:uncharacterized protein n=1 Tax=Penicillium taxi TaxID=168475 RepID=UPI0025456E3A|nr:uncharacterized protein N7495_000362 [Penicillium taxi]KAJ5907680.1 hypothetical protein N7495_000362 [Penicillium taxi]